MELDDRRSLGEGVVARALGDGVEATCLHLFGGRLVEGIAHPHVEAAVDDGDVLVGGMEVGRHLVVRRQAQPDGKFGLLGHVAVEASGLGPVRKRPHGRPLQIVWVLDAKRRVRLVLLLRNEPR